MLEMKVLLDELPSKFQQAIPVLNNIEEHNYEAVFVGGCVRDFLLKKEIHDVDIASSAYPEEIKSLFEKTVDTGIQHGTVMVRYMGEGYEITTYRSESGYTDFRRPDKVEFVRDLTEDLKRRDFTINALALHHTGELVDLFSGLDDLKNKQIKAVGDAHERFNEDALRIMRAFRFASQLDFEIEAKTLLAAKELAPNLENISVERIQVEFEKLMMGTAAQKAIQLMYENNIFAYIPGEWNETTIQALIADLSKEKPQSRISLWNYIFYRQGLNEAAAHQFAKIWKLPNDMNKVSDKLLVFLAKKDIDIVDVYKANSVWDYIKEIINLAQLDYDLSQLDAMFNSLPIKSMADLAISGKEIIALGITPGPLLGQILHDIEIKVVRLELTNDKDSLLSYVKSYK